MKDFIHFVVEALVDNPDKIEITEQDNDDAIIYALKVDQADLGKVIGKQGRTAKAIRTILNAASVKKGKKMVLKIIE
jgi:predicted RNA-binding protein YlqC (UPF0109 family)